MSEIERPFIELGSYEILEEAQSAALRGQSDVVAQALTELEQRSSKAARKAAEEVRALRIRSPRRRGTKPKSPDAKAPCLYAIELKDNPKGVDLYVGMSEAHSAKCKASIHIDGRCLCGVAREPNKHQRRPLPKEFGIGLAYAKEMPEDIDDLEEAEEQWAQELADELGVVVWCNGYAYE